MIRALAIVTLTLAFCGAVGALAAGETNAPDRAGSVIDLFAEANSLYESGDYAGAIDKYSALVARGVEDKDLYYNLANAYYKNDDLGGAVLYYERALRLAPRDKETRENLALVRSQLKDSQFVKEQNWAVKTLVLMHDVLSTNEMFVFASVCYLLLCILVIILIFRERSWVAAAYRRFSVVSPGRFIGLGPTQDMLLVAGVVFLLTLTSSVSAYVKIDSERNSRRAVVVTDEIAVMSSPTNDATLQFKVHEGTIVDMRRTRGEWVRVQLPGGLSGWVPVADLARI